MVLPVPSPVVSTCCLNLESVDFFFVSTRTNMTNKYVHHFPVQDRNCRKSWSVLSRDFGKRNLFQQYFPSKPLVFTHIEILIKHIQRIDGWKWHAAFAETLQNVRQTCLSTNTMWMYTLVRSVLVKSDTNGGYRQFLGGLWSVNRLNRLWTKDRKRAFLRLFRPCTLPKCSSTTTMYHVQPTTTINWDWNNVYRVGRSYHFNCMHMHHTVAVKNGLQIAKTYQDKQMISPT